jgi:hypothetical protein
MEQRWCPGVYKLLYAAMRSSATQPSARPICCAGPATNFCTHDPPCLAPGREYQGNLRLWAASRIHGYLTSANANYMGPADQWTADQQWLFEWVLEALLVHH